MNKLYIPDKGFKDGVKQRRVRVYVKITTPRYTINKVFASIGEDSDILIVSTNKDKRKVKDGLKLMDRVAITSGEVITIKAKDLWEGDKLISFFTGFLYVQVEVVKVVIDNKYTQHKVIERCCKPYNVKLNKGNDLVNFIKL